MPFWRRDRPAAPDADAAIPAGPLIRLEGIGRIFNGDTEEPAVALRDVTLDVDRGEYATISGPSGCGKSTLLSVLALLDTPTSGRYLLNGRPVDRLSPSERARTRNVEIGLVFQSFNLIGDLTVFENVEYPLTVRGVAPNERRDRVVAALDRVGIAARAQQRPTSLSGGHQQLVAVARAIAGRPPLVLADEPTGNLDSKSGAAVMQVLADLHAGGSTVLLATHNPDYIEASPRKIRLFDGQLVA